jgi:hypothetical protein
MSPSAKYHKDFGFVRDRVDEFFSRRTVGQALSLIDEVGISAWEKWWQVEFAAWLSVHDGISECAMEEVFLADHRKDKSKSQLAIDLGFRMKGYPSKEMIFLELKQHKHATKCIANMLRDVEKVSLAQKYSANGRVIRSFFVVGVYPTGDWSKKLIHDYIEESAEDRGIVVHRAAMWTKFVPNSPYSVTVF